MTMMMRYWLGALALLVAGPSTPAMADEFVHVRLKDRLDRPDDGYCFDILGTGSNLRLGLPLFAHNCKRGPTADSTGTFTKKGQLVFPGPNVCVTAFGVNNTALPGSPVLLRPCDYQIAFFNTSNLQKFDHLKNGQLQLRGYELCLAVGDKSSSTYSAADRWRVLSLESCADTVLSHSAWEMVALQ